MGLTKSTVRKVEPGTTFGVLSKFSVARMKENIRRPPRSLEALAFKTSKRLSDVIDVDKRIAHTERPRAE